MLSRWIAFTFCIFASAAFADEASFVNQFVTIRDCKFSKAFLAGALAEGFGRVAVVNPQLPSIIAEKVYGRELSVVCDVEDKESPIFYEPATATIHLRVTNDGSKNTDANFFHEFLHHAGLDHTIDEPKTDEEVVADPVYACHITAFPKIVGMPDFDKKLIAVAAQNCAAVKAEHFTLFSQK